MKINRVISGLQTGGDLAGLYAAEDCKIKTGGYCPKGFRTENGPNIEDGLRFGLVETKESNYQVRTELNIKNSDLTIIFGDDSSSGSKLTKTFCNKHEKKCLLVHEFSNEELVNCYRAITDYFGNDLTINIAGNRESVNPEIFRKTRYFLNLLFLHLNKED